ncbi:MAG: hypothetical protein ACR2JQ_02925 [Mycobacteriales bacterium]
MTSTQFGTLIGVALGIAGAVGGFTVFIIALVLGAVGFVAGRAVDGHIDVEAVFGNRRRP